MKIRLTLKNGQTVDFETENLEWDRGNGGLARLAWDKVATQNRLLWVDVDEIVAVVRNPK